MIIIETCPKCGHALQYLVLTAHPQILQKKCPGCGWSFTEKPEEIVRVPFGGNQSYFDCEYPLMGNIDCEFVGASDVCCAVNNIEGRVFIVDKDSLKNNAISHTRIADAKERIKEYIV